MTHASLAHYIVSRFDGKWRGTYGQIDCPMYGVNRTLCPVQLADPNGGHRTGHTTRVKQREDGSTSVYCFACQADYTDEVVSYAIEPTSWRFPDFISPRSNFTPYFQRLGTHQPEEFGTVQVDEREEKRKAIGKALASWNNGRSWRDSPIPQYLKNRGIERVNFNGETRYRPGGYGRGIMMHRVLNSKGEHTATTHKLIDLRTLTKLKPKDGSAGRFTLGRFEDGCIQLSPWADVIGIAEGPETAWAVTEMTGLPCQAVHGVRYASTYIPDTVKEVIIFGDHGQGGERAANAGLYSLERRGFKAKIILPENCDDDFNKVLAARKGISI